MTTTTRHRVLVDTETIAVRRQTVDMIAQAMEMDSAVWPGDGAAAYVERLRVARRIAAVRWMAQVGEINEAT